MRSDVKEAERCSEDPVGEPGVDLARCAARGPSYERAAREDRLKGLPDSANDEPKIHRCQGQSSSKLDTRVDAEVESGTVVAIACVDPMRDPPALSRDDEISTRTTSHKSIRAYLRHHEQVCCKVDNRIREPEDPSSHRTQVLAPHLQ